MKTIHATIAAGLISLSGGAFAADLPSRSAPAPYIAPPPVFTWSGFYIGLNAGASFRTGNNNGNNNFTTFALTGNPIFLISNNNNNNQVGFVGGGQVGYNWQTGPIVFGLEADAQYRSSIQNGGGNNGFFGGGNNNNNGGFYGTARGRIGYSITPMFMIYATGGAAFGNVGNNNGINFGFFGNNNNDNFRVGYAIGGGLEYAFTPSWSIKAEALYNEIRSNQGGGGFAFGGGNNNRNQFVVARLGVNYKFNLFGVAAAPVVARY